MWPASTNWLRYAKKYVYENELNLQHFEEGPTDDNHISIMQLCKDLSDSSAKAWKRQRRDCFDDTAETR